MALLTEVAAAKINLTLEILGRRPNGFHELRSLVVFAELGDAVTLDTTAACQATPVLDPVRVDGPFADALNRSLAGDNLVDAARKLLTVKRPDLKLGTVHLEKNLPIASGIGGGSADAAALLRLAQRVDQTSNKDCTPAPPAEWFELARALGSDVPACLLAKPLMMSGIGDQLTALTAFPSFYALLVNPLVPVPADKTARVFKIATAPLLAAPEIAKPVSTQDQLAFCASDALQYLKAASNDLQPAAMTLVPQLDHVLGLLGDQTGCQLVRMSGAGPTCFGLFGSLDQLRAAEHDITDRQPGWWVKPTKLAGTH